MICYIQDIKLWITERIQSLRDVFAEGWVAAKKSMYNSMTSFYATWRVSIPQFKNRKYYDACRIILGVSFVISEGI